MTARAHAGLIALVCLAAFGCDPCSGLVSGCVESPTISAQGKIVNHPDGTPASEVEIRLTLDGTPVSSDLTDGDGFFQVGQQVDRTGDVDAEFTISPPGLKPYRVTRRLTARTLRGDGDVLAPWVARPFFNNLVLVVPRCDETRRIANARATVRVTPGMINPIAGPAYSAVTDSLGQLLFLAPKVVADTFAPLVGQLVLSDLPGRPVGAIHLELDYVFRAPLKGAFARVAPDSAYVGCIYHRATNAPAAGVAVDFVRTGGAQTSLMSFSATTDATGAFVLPLGPLAPGPVVGDLTIHQPAPLGVQTAYDAVIGSSLEPADTLEKFGVGVHVPARGRIRQGSTPVAGVKVIIERVGGVAASPDSVANTTNAEGLFTFFGLGPAQVGDLFIDITVLPTGAPAITMRNVRVAAIDADTVSGLAIDWDISVPAASPGQSRRGRWRP